MMGCRSKVEPNDPAYIQFAESLLPKKGGKNDDNEISNQHEREIETRSTGPYKIAPFFIKNEPPLINKQ